MSRLDELIRELCPDGIKYQKLEDTVSIERGRRVVRDQLSKTEGYPVYQNSLTPLGYHTEYNYPAHTTFVIVAGAAGEIGFSNEAFWAADDCFVIVCPDSISNRFIYHTLLREQANIKSKVRKASVPRLSRGVLDKLVIPVPPLPVQREIVRILDNFAELTAELTAELLARKKQYEYYRNLLFEQIEGEDFTISEIATTSIGLATSVTKHKREKGVILLHNSDIQQNAIVIKNAEFISEEFAKKNAKKILKENDIITVHTGDVGTSAVIKGEYIGAIGFTTITTRINDTKRVLPHYLCHYLNSHRCKSDIASMTISDRSNLNQSSYEKLTVPIPSIDEQRRIIQILDSFAIITSDISNGLPAEIEARRKQYEYYRDKLLTFKELS